MKTICVNDSAGFDLLDRVKSSCSVSAFNHVFVIVRSSSATIVCKALARSESFVSTSVSGLGIDTPTWRDDSHRRDARHSHPCEDRRDAETAH